jgi:hypothetical protein
MRMLSCWELAMWIESFRYDLWPSPKRANSPAPENVGGTRARKFGDRERATAPSQERLWLAGLLLVVTGWIIVRLVLMPFAAH